MGIVKVTFLEKKEKRLIKRYTKRLIEILGKIEKRKAKNQTTHTIRIDHTQDFLTLSEYSYITTVGHVFTSNLRVPRMPQELIEIIEKTTEYDTQILKKIWKNFEPRVGGKIS